MGAFLFLPSERALYSPEGVKIELRGQSLEVLHLLIKNADAVVTKSQLRSEIWGTTNVTDDSLIQCISEIRKALGTEHRHLITTIHGRGYRLSRGKNSDGFPIIDTSDEASDISDSQNKIDLYSNDSVVVSDLIENQLVGREQEIALIRQAWEKTINGNGQAIYLSGQAGIGKTAITRYISHRLTNEGRAKLLPLQCTQSHINTSWWPTIQLLLSLSKYNGADSGNRNLDRLVKLVEKNTQDVKPAVAALGNLLGLTEEVELKYGPQSFSFPDLRSQIKTSLCDLLIGQSTKLPVLIVVEDLHWVDPSTLEFIDDLLSKIDHHRILLLVSSRPVHTDRSRIHPAMLYIHLNPLADSQVSAIARRIDKEGTLDGDLLAEVVKHATGIPLYVEELTKSIVSKTIGAVDTDHSSFNLDSALLARVERRSELKLILQAGACVGRCFSYKWISLLTEFKPKKLRGYLATLVEGELIYQRDEPPAASYTFKHELIRQAALNSLTEKHRKSFFKILTDASDSKIKVPDEIRAQYSLEAGCIETSITLWERCGDKSVNQSALEEGRNYYVRAINELRNSDVEYSTQRELELQVKFCKACLTGLGFSDKRTMDAFSQAHQLLIEAGDDNKHIFTIMWGQWLGLNVSGQLDVALEKAYTLRSTANDSQEPLYIFLAQRTVAITSFLSGNFVQASKCFKKAFDLHKPEFDKQLINEFGSDILVSSRINWAHLMLCTGDYQAAFTEVDNIENSRRLESNKHQLAYSLARLSILHQIGRTAECEGIARHAIELGDIHNLTMTSGFAHCALGGSLRLEGKLEEAEHCLESGLSFLRESNTGVFIAYYSCQYAACLAELGKLDQATREMKKAALMIQKGADAWAHAEATRIIGCFEFKFLDKGKHSISKLEHAHKSASSQRALLWTLRLSISLADMYSQVNNSSRGLALLRQEIEKYPVGGNSTADYNEAVKFLNDLE